MVDSKHSYFNNTDAISAELLARTTADGLQNTAISNNTDAITAETLARTTADDLQNTAISIMDAISAETLARTTADGSKTAISNNTDYNNSRSYN
jgi:hypothetical protein